MKNMTHHHFPTPLGTLTLTTGEGNLQRIEFDHPDAPENPQGPTLQEVLATVAGPEKTILLAPQGTPFQQSVWNELLKIPANQPSNYGTVASNIGKPTASRAVGNAIGANPLCILIPCYRVLKSSGKLGGFRWNTTRKQQLLDWETAGKDPLQELCGLQPGQFHFQLQQTQEAKAA